MRKFLLPLFTVFLLIANAQDSLILEIDKLSPRVGEDVILSFNINFLTDVIKEQMAEDVIVGDNLSIHLSSIADFSKSLNFQKPGNYLIGPFTFDFNGAKMVTNSIEITVAEKLPFSEGIWVRYIDAGDKKYIVLEQQIENNSDFKQKKNSHSYTVGGIMDDKAEFTEIETNPEEGVEIKFKSSKSNTISSEIGGYAAAGLSYSIKKYEIIFDEDFDGTFILKKEYFIELPKNVTIEELVIKK